MEGTEPFTVEALLALPRVSELALSADGERLVASVARPDEEGKKFVSALYELDMQGTERPRRLTRSQAGESSPAFAADGSLLFMSARPPGEGQADAKREEKPALWLLPSEAGEARPVARPPGGVDKVVAAQGAEYIAFAAGSHPGTHDWEEDGEKEQARKDAGVGAQLFTDYPIRHWDHYLGPRERHLYLAPTSSEEPSSEEITDLVPEPGRFLDLASFDLTPDGSMLVSSRRKDSKNLPDRLLELVAVDAASGTVRRLAEDEAIYSSPACSPDGRYVVAVREEVSTPDVVGDSTLWLVEIATGEGRDLLEGFDLFPENPVWSAAGDAVFFTADEDGHTLPFQVEGDSGTVSRLAEEGAFSQLCPAPDGQTVYALRSTVSSPPRPVAIDVGDSGEVRVLASFAELENLELPGLLERVTAKAEDGTPVRSWLVLPPAATDEDPAPLATFIHGGPVNSWSGWHWRWSPHVFVENGWAVLLPDPALSTGYGLDYVQRGWGRWGDIVYGDLMSAIEDTANRKEIDTDRTVAMGGSFGGYMANWLAGHTNRFDALVTHASLWDLESFHGTTDLGTFWERQFGDPYEDASLYRKNSPHVYIEKVRTPMLVIHGELDYRVPIGEALKLWTDLKRHGVRSKFLYFPDENHWITKPNNIRVWYATVLGFIAQHALGEQRDRPELL